MTLKENIAALFPPLTPEQCRSASSEAEKYVHLFVKYCCDENGVPQSTVDIACQGRPPLPWAIGMDLPQAEFDAYCGGAKAKGPIHLRSHAQFLPFDDASFSALISSHLLEDFPQSQWPEIMGEWKRVLKPGGYLIILVPEVERWNYAIRVLGQCPNCSHSAPEPSVGDMSRVAKQLGMEVIEERLTECYEHDYSILGVFKRI